VNSRTFKDLWNEIQGLSSTCLVFKYFQGLEFRRKKFKYFQVLSRMHGNPVFRVHSRHVALQLIYRCS